MKTQRIEAKLGIAVAALSLLIMVSTYAFLFIMVRSNLGAIQVSSLSENSETVRTNLSEADVLAEGISETDWQSFLAFPDVISQGFSVGGSNTTYFLKVTKLGDQKYKLETRSAGSLTWLTVNQSRFILFLVIISTVSGLALYASARRSLRPLAELRRTTEDILAGKLEVHTHYRGKDDVGSTFAALKHLCDELERKDQALGQVSELATTDGLTGLKNHRAFKEELVRQLELGKRHNHPVAILLLDVDHFKKFNDMHGHQQGDEVLKGVAKALQETARKTDFVARYGGEEFVLVLPHTDFRGLKEVAERFRQAVAQCDIARLDGGYPLRVTASFGGTALDRHGTAPYQPSMIKDIVEAADRNLYRAKGTGRNRSVISPWKNS